MTSRYEDVRARVLSAIERIVNAEADASGATRKPEITVLDRYALVRNDAQATMRIANAFRRHFPPERVQESQPTTASEDFGCFGLAARTAQNAHTPCITLGNEDVAVRRCADESRR